MIINTLLRHQPTTSTQENHEVITWTKELRDAISAVARDYSDHTFGKTVARDCRERATEFAWMAVGRVMEPHHVEYFQCLRSRLDPGIASHDALNTAWGNAYNANH